MIYMHNNDLQLHHLEYLVFTYSVLCKTQRLENE
jgi:hypothetical protein